MYLVVQESVRTLGVLSRAVLGVDEYHMKLLFFMYIERTVQCEEHTQTTNSSIVG